MSSLASKMILTGKKFFLKISSVTVVLKTMRDGSGHVTDGSGHVITCEDVRASRLCSLCTTLAKSRCSLSRAAAICSLTFAPAARPLCDTQQGASALARCPELQVALHNGEAERKLHVVRKQRNNSGLLRLTSSSARQGSVKLAFVNPVFKGGICQGCLILSRSLRSSVQPKILLPD